MEMLNHRLASSSESPSHRHIGAEILRRVRKIQSVIEDDRVLQKDSGERLRSHSSTTLDTILWSLVGNLCWLYNMN
jgi:hypothetical protein